MTTLAPVSVKVFECVPCGAQQAKRTQHKRTVYAQCAGSCKSVVAKGIARARGLRTVRKVTAHKYICESGAWQDLTE